MAPPPLGRVACAAATDATAIAWAMIFGSESVKPRTASRVADADFDTCSISRFVHSAFPFAKMLVEMKILVEMFEGI